MPSTPVPVFVPFSTTIYLYGFVNAGFNQWIHVVDESGTPVVDMYGTGESNTPTSPASFAAKSPGLGKYPHGYCYTVTISSSLSTSGPWTPSNMKGENHLEGAIASMALVGGEDSTDHDYNDAVLLFMWYLPQAGNAASISETEA